MTFEEAVSKAHSKCVGTYVLSDDIYDCTKEFHNGELEKFHRVCEVLSSMGMDVVDRCVEILYRIVFNVDHEGEVEGADNPEVQISLVEDCILNGVRNKGGHLMRCGNLFGIMKSTK